MAANLRLPKGDATARVVMAASPFPTGIAIDRAAIRLIIATAITGLEFTQLIHGHHGREATIAASVAYIAWALLELRPPRFGSLRFMLPHWFGRLVEIALCLTMILTRGPLLVGCLALAGALFIPRDYLSFISVRDRNKAVGAAAVLALLLVAGPELVPSHAPVPTSPADGSSAAMVIALFASMLFLGRVTPQNRVFDDELLHHVAFASRAPMDRLLELVAGNVRGDVMMAFVQSSGQTPLLRHIGANRGAAADLSGAPDDVVARLSAPTGENVPFLFDTRRRRLLCVDRRGRHGMRADAEFATAWEAVFPPGRGSALPIRMGRSHGWLYVLTDHDLSYRSLLELRNASAAIDALTMRFERFETWRVRTLAEARLLASRDMHDSVLQTLAALRMQLGSMLKASESGSTPALNEQMRSLDQIVAAEQQHLRAILKRSKEDAETAAELFSYLGARAQSLARQWSLRCTVHTPDHALSVSEETAIECEFLLREAISNTARHSQADHLAIRMAVSDGDTLLITLRSDGRHRLGQQDGAPREPTEAESLSLRQRVENLGGKVYREDVRGGAVLSMQIPLERK